MILFSYLLFSFISRDFLRSRRDEYACGKSCGRRRFVLAHELAICGKFGVQRGQGNRCNFRTQTGVFENGGRGIISNRVRGDISHERGSNMGIEEIT